MKKVFKLIVSVALAAAIGFSMAGCATTTIGGAHGDHGLISGFISPNELNEGTQEIESYYVILGLIDIGFKDYATKVKDAEKSGKKITSVSKNYFNVIGITTAYEK